MAQCGPIELPTVPLLLPLPLRHCRRSPRLPAARSLPAEEQSLSLQTELDKVREAGNPL